MTKIITHSGISHLDDFLSVCLITHKDKSVDEIIRQAELSEYELNNSSIWKVDIGKTHNSAIKAFDHHQEEMDDCAFSLLLKYWDIWQKVIEVYSWVTSVAEIDTLGLGKFLEDRRILYEKYFELESFIESTFVELFQKVKVVSKKKNKLLFVIMRMIGKRFFEGIETYQRLERNFESQLNVITISKEGVEEDPSKGILVLIYLTQKPEYCSHLFRIFHKYKKKLFPNYRGSWVIAFSYDRPENSIQLKRYGGTSQINLSKTRSMEKTHFAHEKGFVATVESMSEEELYTYIQHALL